MAFQLPELPYSKDALAPHISAETLEYHYGKHHAGYVAKLNAAVQGTGYAEMTLEEVIKKSSGGLFNNAAQVWNHTFYWNSLSPNGGGEPTGELAQTITDAFGSFNEFKEKFSTAAAGQFGSGWAWLVKSEAGGFEVMTFKDAQTPLTKNVTPLFTCDVWEHAYYIDYRNARPKYIESFWNLVNWDFVEANLKK